MVIVANILPMRRLLLLSRWVLVGWSAIRKVGPNRASLCANSMADLQLKQSPLPARADSRPISRPFSDQQKYHFAAALQCAEDVPDAGQPEAIRSDSRSPVFHIYAWQSFREKEQALRRMLSAQYRNTREAQLPEAVR
jgi:hypothetical protein